MQIINYNKSSLETRRKIMQRGPHWRSRLDMINYFLLVNKSNGYGPIKAHAYV